VVQAEEVDEADEEGAEVVIVIPMVAATTIIIAWGFPNMVLVSFLIGVVIAVD
jgi:hypothetical protein